MSELVDYYAPISCFSCGLPVSRKQPLYNEILKNGFPIQEEELEKIGILLLDGKSKLVKDIIQDPNYVNDNEYLETTTQQLADIGIIIDPIYIAKNNIPITRSLRIALKNKQILDLLEINNLCCRAAIINPINVPKKIESRIGITQDTTSQDTTSRQTTSRSTVGTRNLSSVRSATPQTFASTLSSANAPQRRSVSRVTQAK